MDNYLITKIKSMKGSLLGIGVTSEKIKSEIEKNDKITICNLLEETTKKGTKKLKVSKRQRKINIKKIKKIFRKKRINNIICNFNTIQKFLKTFVRDSVYINKENLYIYGPKEELKKLKIKYERYTKDIELIEKKENSILVVNNKNTKNNKLKDIGYWWVDTVEIVLDYLTILLAN